MMKKYLAIMLILIGLFLSGDVFSNDSNSGISANYRKGVEYYGYKAYRLALYEFKKVLAVNPEYSNTKEYVKLINQSLVLEHDNSYLSAREGTFLDKGNTLESEVKSLSRGKDRSFRLENRERGLEQKIIEEKNQDKVSLAVKKLYEEVALNKLQSKQGFPPVNRIKELVSSKDIFNNTNSKDLVSQRKLVEKNKILEAELVQNLNEYKREHSERNNRKQVVSKTLEDTKFEMSLEYQFISGDQIFKVIYDDGSPLSKLTYRIDGVMGYINAEARLSPKWSIGGRFGSSDLHNTTSRDEDWNVAPFVYQYTDQNTSSKMKSWEANIYYRFLDLDKDSLDKQFAETLRLDRFYLDGFVGYQQQDGRYTMMDAVSEALYLDGAGDWWQAVGLPLNAGLDSLYEVTYKGPRLGVRVGGSFTEKISTKLSLSYAWIETKAHGCWNLRSYDYWHQGYNGSALNVDYEALFHLTPSWFIGAGIHYAKHTQKTLEAWGVQPSGSFTDADYVRDTVNTVIGPSLKVGYRW
ncbi:MAG: hypothetical protein KAJ14_06060 [Candidatus Omnitrophica bacterium]|nr:hypothetical protein [Candidatus Omnitrophota bacterium]